ncbi:MAG: lipoyl(octanoyl) transferase LipB [Chloroflexota bacterium]|nr:lipoyl(octanoyl) transferase LipB [Chloroflexota bacterium]
MISKSKYIQAFFLGKMSYLSAMNLQEKINSLIYLNKLNETILFLEHDNVFTYGSKEKISPKEIENLNESNLDFQHIRTNRGGQITLHSPGQLICYPIINLKNHFNGVLDYVKFLENIIIKTLNFYKIKAHTVQKRRGIWVNGDPNEEFHERNNPSGEKIAALGLKIVRNITLHGFSLNVNNDLKLFNLFIPCGMPNLRVNSVSNILGQTTNIKEVAQNLSLSMSEILQIPIEFNSDINKIGVKVD